MQVATGPLDLLPRRPARWVLIGTIAVLGAVALLAVVAFASLGPTEFKSSTAVWLDDHHVWGQRTQWVRAAKRLEAANPEADAKAAIANGDVRLIPAAGLGEFFPGLPGDAFDDYYQRYGARDLIYAGCVTSSEEESRFRDAAFEYASKYNETVIAQVKR